VLTASHAAIGVFTRALMRELAAGGDLDEASELLLLRQLEKTRPRSHCGWVFALAEALGASREPAMHAGSFAELCCAAIDLVDDVQDGDAGQTLGDVPLAVQVNISEHMLVLSVLGAARLEQVVGHGPGSLVREAYRLFSAMASGQRMEVSREDWSPHQYELVASLTCGKQYELYLRTAAFAADAEVEPLLALAAPLGVATQIACDLLASDPRLLRFSEPEVERMRADWTARTRQVLDRVPALARPVLSQVSLFPLEHKLV
jgi:hypothetical protein